MRHRINIILYSLLITLTCLFFSEHPYFIYLLIGFTFLFISIITAGVLFLKLNYFLPSINRLQNDDCILTFDDGPDEETTPTILDTLAKHNVKAIFFVIGKKAEKNPQLIKRIIDEGHLIGDHSYSHNKLMATFSTAKLREELTKSQTVLKKMTGENISLFRIPIGYSNPNFARVIKQLNLTSIGWTLRSYDTLSKDSSELKTRLVNKTKPGSIILLHDNLAVTADALDSYISESASNGILFASSININKLKHV